jgi:uncharacterized protein YkwD
MQRRRIGRPYFLHMTAIGIFFKGSGREGRLEGKSMKSVSFCVLAALALAGCAGDASLSRSHTVLSSSTNDATQAAALISAYRTSRGLSPVTVDSRLNDAAEYQARVVAAAGKLSHGSFGNRMEKFGIMGYAAENLSAGSSSVGGAVNRWKASPGHDRNLLMPEARRIGLARADAQGGYGRYWALVLGQ